MHARAYTPLRVNTNGASLREAIVQIIKVHVVNQFIFIKYKYRQMQERIGLSTNDNTVCN
jgi:hypothetical protein